LKFKLKYKDGAKKKICMLLASAQRRKFSKLVWAGKLNVPLNDKNLDFDIISFSGKRDFEEQVLSIYSFVFHIGVPHHWVVYSDGSHSDLEKDMLVKMFPFVTFKLWNSNPSLNDHILLRNYLETCHLAKKLHAILGHEYGRQTIYVDSDIVFYRKALPYFNSNLIRDDFWYINDCTDAFALNSGLLILNKNFNFKYVYEYLESLHFEFEYFSEQSAFNYAFKKQNAGVLEPDKFIVDLTDQFKVSMGFTTDEIALRHYVNPVRHKMWQKGWEWHFKN
jgi:hypothetical protein